MANGMHTIAVICLFLISQNSILGVFSFSFQSNILPIQCRSNGITSNPIVGLHVNAISHEEIDNSSGKRKKAQVLEERNSNRRSLLKSIIAIPLFWNHKKKDAYSKSNIKPEIAFKNLQKAQEELLYAQKTYLPKKDYEGLRDYLSNDAINMNEYDLNAASLLESKALDIESKKAIGTIRRYGVGADVIIMYGSLKGEIDEENQENDSVNFNNVDKYLKRTLDSLAEVILICRSNGFK